MSMKIPWDIPEPVLPEDVHPALSAAARAAAVAGAAARRRHTRRELAEPIPNGADGTATMRVDQIVEDAIVEVAHRHGVNLLSEEVGHVDNGSAVRSS